MSVITYGLHKYLETKQQSNVYFLMNTLPYVYSIGEVKVKQFELLLNKEADRNPFALTPSKYPCYYLIKMHCCFQIFCRSKVQERAGVNTVGKRDSRRISSEKRTSRLSEYRF